MKKTKGTTRKIKQTGGVNLFGMNTINKNKETELRKQADEKKEEIRPLFIIMEKDIARKALNDRMENGDVSAAQELYEKEYPWSMSTDDIDEVYKKFDEKAKELEDIMHQISVIDVNKGGKRKRKTKTKKAK
jgi:hypothetical protein